MLTAFTILEAGYKFVIGGKALRSDRHPAVILTWIQNTRNHNLKKIGLIIVYTVS